VLRRLCTWGVELGKRGLESNEMRVREEAHDVIGTSGAATQGLTVVTRKMPRSMAMNLVERMTAVVASIAVVNMVIEDVVAGDDECGC
jgi:hypothetical protein